MKDGLLTKILRRLRALRHRRLLAQCAQIEGWLTTDEALGLYYTARSLPPGARILEIGSWKGKSTFMLASGLADGKVLALDPFDAAGEPGSREEYEEKRGSKPLLEQFKDNLRSRGVLEKVEALPGYSRDFAGKFNALDFLFIDGDHSKEGCSYDFNTFSGAVKRGGFLGFHDYDASRADLGPTWTVENLVKRSKEWRLAMKADSLIVFERI